MWTLDDLKTNRDTQITVICIGFFLIAFPAYFSFAASGVDGASGMGGVRDYEVSGELTFVQLDAGTEYVADGQTWSETFNTDSIDSADELNIVGVRLTLSYDEDEDSTAACIGGDGADTISGMVTHLNISNTGEGQNNGGNGAHDVSAEWYNSSMTGVISGLTEAEIMSEIDSMGAGLGDHMVEISVTANTGGQVPPIACQRTDDGEDVSYTVELIVFDYTIAPYIELTDV